MESTKSANRPAQRMAADGCPLQDPEPRTAGIADCRSSVQNIKQVFMVCGCCLLAIVLLADEPTTNRPASWAQPIKLEGVANLHRVSTNLYRSAQPTAQGMRNLKQMGIRTVVNLRSFNSDRKEIGTTALGYEHIYMKAWHPERKEVVRFLQIVTNPKRQPVLLHCQHGADRTGTMCAMYRVAVQGWTKEEAIREMTKGGFGFHEVWKNLPKWIEELDIESIRREAGIIGAPMSAALAAERSPQTDWLKDARIGAFMHFLPSPTNGGAAVKAFDVDALAQQLDSMGARYFVFTLGQNTGWFNAPNAVYDRVAGFKPGERCATRDLPVDLYRALSAKGIRLMLYLPCQTPNRDARAQKAFGLQEGPQDQPLDLAFAGRWAEVIQEWSERYGEKVSGWWFDGGYRRVHFNDDIARIYANAAKRGNARAIVTFNPGVKLIRHTEVEDYTAGELKDPFTVVPKSRWVDGSQWHALTYLGGSWGRRDTRLPTERWQEWFKEVAAQGGAVTLDMGPNMDPEVGPIGMFSEEQSDQFRKIAQRVEISPIPDKASKKPNKPDAGDGL